MARTYDNIYPSWPHDPHCACCHPNDRPYCDCACHRAPSKIERAALRLGRQIIPCRPAMGPTPLLPATHAARALAEPVTPPQPPRRPEVPDYNALDEAL